MQLMKVDKALYRQRLNVVLVSLVASLTLLSLGFGTVLIEFFGNKTVASGESTGHFHLNLLGVILAVLTCSLVMNFYKKHEYLKEIYWVWKLKQLHNRIYRKLAKIKLAARDNDPDALTVLLFYLTTQKQVFELDNNTLTLATLQADISAIESKLADLNLEITTADFSENLLEKF
ncbi:MULTISPECIES: DUF3087 domain-containing protein [unclassified Shewanella]|uniref:DUF3087 domain-containing protein n=1 Tax=unclassified Shewanella TaxID=196818 RepID=UPI000C81B754|nr:MULTISPECIES: DUF3087 domain-containing protein [unclassified Shewanella]MDO6639717.1 DUF3087 domain-containing protein [Shewanella sp. 5_MG-2023]MDO6677656.1 DUF3087 domain-containing protein [Shewanella sp. 4_MG-2023]MDO6776816.1 DUF3087 domain-containing protein [Shewanella sp. 3_MG-2023]PMG50097.1 hypothetical protein BCU91_17670 [Shewanella sp. 10N.286.52.B9]PMH88902.1 hypothetical protein BCU57_19265 [Shewanella sp. 10N.286.48.B5]